MIAALRRARSITDPSFTAEAFHELVDLYPLAFGLGSRHRYTDPILDEAIEFLDGPDSPYINGKTRLFIFIVRRIQFSDVYANRLRPASLRLPAEAYGDGTVSAVAAAARSLADRLASLMLRGLRLRRLDLKPGSTTASTPCLCRWSHSVCCAYTSSSAMSSGRFLQSSGAFSQRRDRVYDGRSGG